MKIRAYINDNRYTTNKLVAKAPSIEIINEVLNLDLPIKLTSTMNHTHLAQRYARLITNRTVYVYDNDMLVEGSPFSTYRDALTAIDKPRTSSRIKRNIDTGKLYLNRYRFYSAPKK